MAEVIGALTCAGCDSFKGETDLDVTNPECPGCFDVGEPRPNWFKKGDHVKRGGVTISLEEALDKLEKAQGELPHEGVRSGLNDVRDLLVALYMQVHDLGGQVEGKSLDPNPDQLGLLAGG